MNTTVLWIVLAVLTLGFVVGGIAAWQASKEHPLPTIRISAPLHPDEGGLTKGYISVRNTGKSLVDLSGWTLSNEVGVTFTFPEGFTLAAGSVVTVYTGCAEDAEGAPGLYWCARQIVWRAEGGRASLSMPDATTVDTYSFTHVCASCLIK